MTHRSTDRLTGPIEGTASIRSIRTESDYQAALGEVAALMGLDPAPGTPEGDRLDALVTLLQAYEARHFPVAGAEGAIPGGKADG